MEELGGASLIDLLHLERERVIGCWDLGGALVDPGPESCVEALLAGLSEEPVALLLTHIHLDHAGAAGALVRRFPDLEVWVHELGAPHLADPSRLLRSAERLYGDDMERLWGGVTPVPEGNLRALRGGEVVEVAGRRVAVSHAPGHASHHVVYLDLDAGTAYVGDVAGVRIPPADFIHPPTPPPDIDVEAWERSLAMVAAMEPATLALTHFGAVAEPLRHLADMGERLRAQAELAQSLVMAGGDHAEAEFVSACERAVRAATDPEIAAVYIQAAPCRQLWLGLERYWVKRQVSDVS